MGFQKCSQKDVGVVNVYIYNITALEGFELYQTKDYNGENCMTFVVIQIINM